MKYIDNIVPVFRISDENKIAIKNIEYKLTLIKLDDYTRRRNIFESRRIL